MPGYSKRPTHFKHTTPTHKTYASKDSKELESTHDFTPKQHAKVGKVLEEFEEGKLKTSGGRKVTDRKQAVAIALSEARREGRGERSLSAHTSSGRKITIEKTEVPRGAGNNPDAGPRDKMYTIKEWGYVFPDKEAAEKYADTHEERNGVIRERTEPRAVERGARVEAEHKKTIEAIKKPGVSTHEAEERIAKDHLKEDPHYYEKLKRMEATKHAPVHNQEQLYTEYFDGRTSGTTASSTVEGDKIYSYGTVIGVKKGKTFYLNERKYSTTTSKMQTRLERDAQNHGYDVVRVRPDQTDRTDNSWTEKYK